MTPAGLAPPLGDGLGHGLCGEEGGRRLRPLKSDRPKTEGERPSSPAAKRSLAPSLVRWLILHGFRKRSGQASALLLEERVTCPLSWAFQTLEAASALRNQGCQRSFLSFHHICLAFLFSDRPSLLLGDSGFSDRVRQTRW